ncbi:hypothetical protein CYMTET_27354 [Cymbomonas tetramitiformis]|uniref:HhH-GPD domain-containing protein n=1 Tax=Cymbomonas tetramitiformis TaxID=36881 RepID=A0AAE0KXB0_9CHLO|nr:hypothetical protein CYMTET_27354 [Cymbomonas tetramitiformis]
MASSQLPTSTRRNHHNCCKVFNTPSELKINCSCWRKGTRLRNTTRPRATFCRTMIALGEPLEEVKPPLRSARLATKRKKAEEVELDIKPDLPAAPIQEVKPNIKEIPQKRTKVVKDEVDKKLHLDANLLPDMKPSIKPVAKKAKSQTAQTTESKVQTPAKRNKASAEDVFASSPKSLLKSYTRPSEQECRAVHRALVELHGAPNRPTLEGPGTFLERTIARKSVLDSLVGTILSQNTTDTNSHRSFACFKDTFPTYEAVLNADPNLVADSIRSGGLADTKTKRIQSILQSLKEERGELSLEYLHGLSTEDVKKELNRFKGVGPKTVACVLMFTLCREEFPVDTHVWKIALELGWVPAKADREMTYAHLNQMVPDDIKFDLHVLLVEHGKVVWRANSNSSPDDGKHVCAIIDEGAVKASTDFLSQGS